MKSSGFACLGLRLMVEQNRAPLYEALRDFVAKAPLSMHVPGHKSGQIGFASARVRHREYSELFGCLTPFEPFENILPYDLTELPGLDDLHAPHGAIAEAQQLAATLYGADETHFLVGGSTVGNLAFILGTCAPGDLLIVDRNVHKSVFHGLLLADAKAVFVQTEIIDGIPQGPSIAHFLQAIAQFPEAKGILLTRPTYYGTVPEIKEIIAAAQKKNMVVCVDEAHGAHLGLHPALPQSALQLGADVVIQSTHKMLPAMTMAAMLHLKGDRAAKRRINHQLRMLQSSSPSYPLLASLDLARHYAATQAPADIAQSLLKINAFLHNNNQPVSDDPFKWVWRDPNGTLSGYELYNNLIEHGIYAEMADEQKVVLYFGLSVTDEGIAQLQQALDDILQSAGGVLEKQTSARTPSTESPFEVISFSRMMLDRPTETVQLEHAVGKPIAEIVIPYPPGVAMMVPGERITTQHIEKLKTLQASNAHVQGVADASLTTLRIFTEE
jgi:arginine decarboxylase